MTEGGRPPADVSLLADHLLNLLGVIDAGEIKTSAATRHRIEGAIVGLSALDGATAGEIIERLGRISGDETA